MVLQILSLGVVMLSAVVLSAPPSGLKDVLWFEMEPVIDDKTSHPQEKELAKTEFESDDKEWIRFKDTYGKVYNTSIEELNRFLIFRDNLEYIIKHNQEYNKGNKSYFLGISEVADMTTREIFRNNGFLRRTNRRYKCSSFLKPSYVEVPDSVDWRTKGYVTKVKNQGSCGSCWSFSTTGSLEGQLYKKTNKLIPLSEQQLVDCSGSFGNMGCSGGLMDQSFAYIKSAGGIMSEEDYTYRGRQGKCHADKSKFVGSVTGCKGIPRGDEGSLQIAVATVGPVSVAINAARTFMLYKGGIYDEPKCTALLLNHAVLVVGYGTKESAEYWTVKNSWGTSWGQSGYILMSRNKKNQCGIASMASYPLV